LASSSAFPSKIPPNYGAVMVVMTSPNYRSTQPPHEAGGDVTRIHLLEWHHRLVSTLEPLQQL